MRFWQPDELKAAAGGVWLVRPPAVEVPKDRPADLPPPPAHHPVQGLSIDTRTLRPGEAFLALRGERHDGHRFLEAAVRGGASLLIIDDESAIPTDGFATAATPDGQPGKVAGILKVTDTGKALLKIAGAHRQTLTRVKVIAVCGSNGKTTTTRLLSHVLSQSLRGTASPKSFNNAVGVPLTILGASPGDQYLICEIGTNHPGELSELASLVQPDIAVITSIGREHLEGFGDLAGVAREESQVLKHLRSGGCAVVTADSPELDAELRKFAALTGNAGNERSARATVSSPRVSSSGKNLGKTLTDGLGKATPVTSAGAGGAGAMQVIRFGKAESADLRLTSCVPTAVSADCDAGMEFTINRRISVRLEHIGEHNALNAIAALAVARRLGIDEAKAVAALATAPLPEMRLQRSTIRLGSAATPLREPGFLRIVNDSYNANPESMLAALAAVLDAPRASGVLRRVVVLGDMLELGEAGPSLHRVIADDLLRRAGGLVRSSDGGLDGEGRAPDLAVLVGTLMQHAFERLHEGRWPSSRVLLEPEADEGAFQRIAASLLPGDEVLLKGSRGMKMERLLGALAASGRSIPETV